MFKQDLSSNDTYNQLTVPAFGYELIRDWLLNDLFGQDSKAILYIAGKNIARSYPLGSIDEITEFFSKAGWGKLEILKEDSKSITFELSGELLVQRLTKNKDIHFQIEAGFLAEEIQSIKKFRTEANEQVKFRSKTVRFTVQWDDKEII